MACTTITVVEAGKLEVTEAKFNVGFCDNQPLGDTVEAYAIVKNTGGMKASGTFILYITKPDGKEYAVDSATVTLNPGEDTILRKQVTLDQAGKWSVRGEIRS